MTLFEAYTFLFVDSLLSALIVPLQEELVLPAMQIFGTYDVRWMVVLPVLAVGLASVVNWWLGRIIRLAGKGDLADTHSKLTRILAFCRKYGFWTMLLTPLPVIGAAVTVALGYTGARLPKILLLASVSKAVAVGYGFL